MKVENNINQQLKKYEHDKIQAVKDLIANAVTAVEILATRAAPKFVTIDKKISGGGFVGEVGVFGGESDIAAYFEFGTGLSAQQILAPYPQWVKDIAWEFYVNGKGTLKGKPYLYNNFLKIQEETIKELNKLMKA